MGNVGESEQNMKDTENIEIHEILVNNQIIEVRRRNQIP